VLGECCVFSRHTYIHSIMQQLVCHCQCLGLLMLVGKGRLIDPVVRKSMRKLGMISALWMASDFICMSSSGWSRTVSRLRWRDVTRLNGSLLLVFPSVRRMCDAVLQRPNPKPSTESKHHNARHKVIAHPSNRRKHRKQ